MLHYRIFKRGVLFPPSRNSPATPSSMHANERAFSVKWGGALWFLSQFDLCFEVSSLAHM